MKFRRSLIWSESDKGGVHPRLKLESAVNRLPHSDQLREIERIRRIRDGNVLEVQVTKEHPKAYAQPL